MTSQFRLFLDALQCYTRLPAAGRPAQRIGPESGAAARGARYLPLVGTFVGILQALVYIGASVALPHPVALILAIGAGLLLTGACHEQGWASFCDGLGRARSERRMPRPSRRHLIGAGGAVGVAMLLLLRFETLVGIDSDWVAAAVVCAAAFSRGCAVLAMTGMPPAGPGDPDEAGPSAPRASGADAIVALGWAALPLLLLTLWIRDAGPASVALALALLATAAIRRFVRRRPQGPAGDPLGAVQPVAEAAFLLGLLIALGVPVVDDLPDDALHGR
jgi:adenosylcobinamide-GDP ribazoletransferase